jgi:hypothetical protein
VRGRVEAESKYDSWYQSETMKGLGRKRGKMDLAQTQVVVDKPKSTTLKRKRNESSKS